MTSFIFAVICFTVAVIIHIKWGLKLIKRPPENDDEEMSAEWFFYILPYQARFGFLILTIVFAIGAYYTH